MTIKPSDPISPDPIQVKEPEPLDWVIVEDKEQLYRGRVNKITGPGTFSLTIDQMWRNGWINVMSSYTWCTVDRIVKMEG
jgi:hypothetical protein